MFRYLRAVSREPDDDRIRAFCEDSVEHFDWIEALGMRFERSFYPEKAVIQPGTEGLMYTGNEKVHPFRDLARPAPRGHKVPQPGDTGGAKMVLDALAARISETSVDVRYETGATQPTREGPAGTGDADCVHRRLSGRRDRVPPGVRRSDGDPAAQLQGHDHDRRCRTLDPAGTPDQTKGPLLELLGRLRIELNDRTAGRFQPMPAALPPGGQ